MGITTIYFIPLTFICFTALYMAHAELILLHHKDTFYCVGSRDKEPGKSSNRTSFNDINSKSRWLPTTRNELSDLNSFVSKENIGNEWIQRNDNNIDRDTQTVFECNTSKCTLRKKFKSSQATELCFEIVYSSSLKGKIKLYNCKTNMTQGKDFDLIPTNGTWKRSRFDSYNVSRNIEYTLILENVDKGFKIRELRVCSNDEYHVTRLKTNVSPTCSIIGENKPNITMKEIEGTEVSVYPNCPVGTLGKNCELRCSEIILGNKDCHGVIACSQTGSCSCLNGLSGTNCDQECMPGSFGAGCRSKCNCKDQHPCDQVTGYCHWGCAPGWLGNACNKNCNNGYYGANCKERCNANCKYDQLCNHITGECADGCKTGWNGRMCDSPCQNTRYGANCYYHCHCKNGAACNATTGECKEGCRDGWKGNTCNTSCESELYGKDCMYRCSGNCKQDDPCNSETGTCPQGCDLGWGGDKCDTSCSAGTYGYNCSKTCPGRCKNNLGCDSKYGNCTMGCADGYIGEKCDISLILIGVSVLIVAFFTITSVLCMAWTIRYKRKARPEPRPTASHSHRPRYSMPKFFRQSSVASSIDHIYYHRKNSVPDKSKQETSAADLNEPTPSTSREEASTFEAIAMTKKAKPRAGTPPRPMPRSFKFSFKKKLRQTKIPVLPGDPGSQYDDILNLDGGVVQEYQYIENNERESIVESVQSPL